MGHKKYYGYKKPEERYSEKLYDDASKKVGARGSVPKSVSGKNPLKSVNFRCHCKFNVLFLIVL